MLYIFLIGYLFLVLANLFIYIPNFLNLAKLANQYSAFDWFKGLYIGEDSDVTELWPLQKNLFEKIHKITKTKTAAIAVGILVSLFGPISFALALERIFIKH